MTSDNMFKLQTLAGSAPGPRLLITGGVHGDELEPMEAVRRLRERVKLELAQLCGTVTLVPVVNEAALARGSRVAEDGLDLARTCPGRVDGTITERIAHALSQLIRAADYYIDLHTGGQALCVWPLTGYMLHSRREILDQQRAMARAFGLPVIWGTDPALEGRSLSVARDASVPAIYAEYLGGSDFSEAGVQAYVDGCLNVMIQLKMLPAKTSQQFSASAEPLIVEDARPHSGHMQRCYPAPAAGSFEAAVRLGQPIRVGQLLGTVTDPLWHERHEVHSTQTGRVLVLRVLPHVQTGDSLAVVLETDVTS
jgi:predicted deacylase